MYQGPYNSELNTVPNHKQSTATDPSPLTLSCMIALAATPTFCRGLQNLFHFYGAGLERLVRKEQQLTQQYGTRREGSKTSKNRGQQADDALLHPDC